MGVRAKVNQVVQIGVEATHGTGTVAGKLLSAWDWTFGAKAATKQFTGTGRKYPSASAELTEYSVGKIAGHGDFAALVYPLSSVWSAATIASVGTSTTAKSWTFVPPIAGAAAPKSFVVQQGDANDAEQYQYLMFSGWGYTIDRKQEITITGDWFAQTLTDSATMTTSPTNIALLPMVGAQANVYLDTTSAGLGTTQLSNILKVEFKASNYFGQYWPLNRANASFTSYIDMPPKDEIKLTLNADTTAMALRSTYLQADTVLAYIQVSVVGPTIATTPTVTAQMIHDLACFCSDISEFTDDDGVYAVEFTFQVAEDTGWSSGQSQTLVLQNLLTAL
jgi:hypothetical protein